MHSLSFFLLISFLLCSASANQPAIDEIDFTSPENVTVNAESLEEVSGSTQSSSSPSSSSSSSSSTLSTSITQEIPSTTSADDTCHLEKCATTMMNNTERMMEKLQKALGMILIATDKSSIDPIADFVKEGCGLYYQFNQCMGGDWFGCLDKTRVVRAINNHHRVKEYGKTWSFGQLREVNDLFTSFCTHILEDGFSIGKCDSTMIAKNSMLVDDFISLSQFEFESCKSMSCGFAHRIIRIFTSASHLACGDSLGKLAYALSRSAVNSCLSKFESEECDLQSANYTFFTLSPQIPVETYLVKFSDKACGADSQLKWRENMAPMKELSMNDMLTAVSTLSGMINSPKQNDSINLSMKQNVESGNSNEETSTDWMYLTEEGDGTCFMTPLLLSFFRQVLNLEAFTTTTPMSATKNGILNQRDNFDYNYELDDASFLSANPLTLAIISLIFFL